MSLRHTWTCYGANYEANLCQYIPKGHGDLGRIIMIMIY